MELDNRPKILQIVEIVQAIAVVFVALSVVGWSAFYVQSCHSWPAARIVSYFALIAAISLYILAAMLGNKISDLLEQGCKPLTGTIIHVLMLILVTSSYLVVGLFALDNWSYRLEDCSGAVASIQ